MSYTVQNIQTGDVITADMLNTMDEGVAANAADIEELQSAVTALQEAEVDVDTATDDEVAEMLDTVFGEEDEA